MKIFSYEKFKKDCEINNIDPEEHFWAKIIDGYEDCQDGDEEGYSMHCENFVYYEEDAGYKIKEFEIEDFQDLYTINSVSTAQLITNEDFCETICREWGIQGENI